LREARPDVVCLQELKVTDSEFPIAAIEKAGYGAIWRGQKSWNGVAILARGCEPVVTRTILPGEPADTQSRYIEAAVGVLIATLYAPNGNPQPGRALSLRPLRADHWPHPFQGDHLARFGRLVRAEALLSMPYNTWGVAAGPSRVGPITWQYELLNPPLCLEALEDYPLIDQDLAEARYQGWLNPAPVSVPCRPSHSPQRLILLW
jgi:endonuclease/exonuclease/phosphatase family protein